MNGQNNCVKYYLNKAFEFLRPHLQIERRDLMYYQIYHENGQPWEQIYLRNSYNTFNGDLLSSIKILYELERHAHRPIELRLVHKLQEGETFVPLAILPKEGLENVFEEGDSNKKILLLFCTERRMFDKKTLDYFKDMTDKFNYTLQIIQAYEDEEITQKADIATGFLDCSKCDFWELYHVGIHFGTNGVLLINSFGRVVYNRPFQEETTLEEIKILLEKNKETTCITELKNKEWEMIHPLIGPNSIKYDEISGDGIAGHYVLNLHEYLDNNTTSHYCTFKNPIKSKESN